MAEVETIHNNKANYFFPLAPAEMAKEAPAKAQWLSKNFDFSTIHALFSLQITDLTYGELAVEIKKF